MKYKTMKELHEWLDQLVYKLQNIEVPDERKQVLEPLIQYIRKQLGESSEVVLNFICTHNSRRSHLAMIWAHTAANVYGIKAQCHSWWTDATQFFHRSVSALLLSGFHVEKQVEEKIDNPIYLVSAFKQQESLICFSKRFDHPDSPRENFAAVVVCDNADNCCPQIFQWTKIPVKYVDPKIADSWEGASEEEKIAHYKERSDQIWGEMLYVFRTISEKIA